MKKKAIIIAVLAVVLAAAAFVWMNYIPRFDGMTGKEVRETNDALIEYADNQAVYADDLPDIRDVVTFSLPDGWAYNVSEDNRSFDLSKVKSNEVSITIELIDYKEKNNIDLVSAVRHMEATLGTDGKNLAGRWMTEDFVYDWLETHDVGTINDATAYVDESSVLLINEEGILAVQLFDRAEGDAFKKVYSTVKISK